MEIASEVVCIVSGRQQDKQCNRSNGLAEKRVVVRLCTNGKRVFSSGLPMKPRLQEPSFSHTLPLCDMVIT